MALRPATPTADFDESFAAVALDATGAAKAATVVLRAFTGARAETTTRVADEVTAKDILCGGVRCGVRGGETMRWRWRDEKVAFLDNDRRVHLQGFVEVHWELIDNID